MRTFVVLACGPDGTMLLMLAGAALGALTLTVSFLVGFVCLFTSKRKLGLWLTSVPVLVTSALYLAYHVSQRGSSF